jgi:predicted CXXCH cytochrome family protein
MTQVCSIRLVVLTLSFIAFFMISAHLFTTTASAAELPCLQCHKSKKAGKVVHSAVETGCSTCHGEPHREEKPELDLTEDVPELCYECHDEEMFQKKSVHSAVAAGMCTSCHNPHSSNLEKLLTAEPPGLCYGCHDKGMFTKEVQHSPVADGECLVCHDPHASDYAYNLTSPPGDLCAMCHPDKPSGRHILAGLGFGDAHPTGGRPDPSRKGKELSCVSCHSPHSSSYKWLLVRDGTKTENLCLMCHKKSSLRFN